MAQTRDGGLTREQRAQLAITRWTEGMDTVRTLIRYACYVAVAWIVYLCVRQIAGQETTAQILLGLLVDVGSRTWVAWLIAVVMVVWALLERGEKRRKTLYLSGRISALEQQLDPRRTSSELMPTGETRKEDLP